MDQHTICREIILNNYSPDVERILSHDSEEVLYSQNMSRNELQEWCHDLVIERNVAVAYFKEARIMWEHCSQVLIYNQVECEEKDKIISKLESDLDSKNIWINHAAKKNDEIQTQMQHKIDELHKIVIELKTQLFHATV